MRQGISAVEHMCGRDNVLNHLSVPAACFTHPEVRRGGPRSSIAPLHPSARHTACTLADVAPLL